MKKHNPNDPFCECFELACYKAGKSINMRALSHFIGLVMANEQLKNSLTTT